MSCSRRRTEEESPSEGSRVGSEARRRALSSMAERMSEKIEEEKR